MSNQDLSNLPAPSDSDSEQDGHTHNHLNVNNLHLHGNDIRELRKLAEVSPELAHKIVDQRERQSVREETSFRFGLTATLLLVGTLIVGVVYIVVNAGIIALICAIAVILATAMLIRVVLTGEWSETSWVGQLLESASKLLGAKDPSEK